MKLRLLTMVFIRGTLPLCGASLFSIARREVLRGDDAVGFGKVQRSLRTDTHNDPGLPELDPPAPAHDTVRTGRQIRHGVGSPEPDVQPVVLAGGCLIIAVEPELERDRPGVGIHARPCRLALDGSDPGGSRLTLGPGRRGHRHVSSTRGGARAGLLLGRRCYPGASHGDFFLSGRPVLDDPAELLGSLGAPIELAQCRAQHEAQTDIVWRSLQRFPVLRDSAGVVPAAREQVTLLAAGADARGWRWRRGRTTASRRQRQPEQDDRNELPDHLLIGPAGGRY